MHRALDAGLLAGCDTVPPCDGGRVPFVVPTSLCGRRADAPFAGAALAAAWVLLLSTLIACGVGVPPSRGELPDRPERARAKQSPTALPRAEPCPTEAQWPEGMACVNGGRFQLSGPGARANEAGSDTGWVFVDTFFMDRHEVTNGRYEVCIVAGSCKRPMRFRRFMGEQQPVVAVSWFDAKAYCERLGRRLPTEAEWERAAAGPEDTTFPWGDAPLGCERANVMDDAGRGCGGDVTKDVGSYPSGHFGLFDMAGNVHEWVADAYSECLRGCAGECGDACFGNNPRGPCGGADRCPGHGLKSVRGGSWYWALSHARAQARRGSGPKNLGPHRFGFRCASDLRSETEAHSSSEEERHVQ